MPKLVFSGKVIKKSGNKSIVVAVSRRFASPMYGKVVKMSKKYHVHDENHQHKVGDAIKIIESKPISKLKRWVVLPADESKRDLTKKN